MAIPDTQPVILHESTVNRLLRYVTPVVLLLIGVSASLRVGELRIGPAIFLFGGVVLLLVSLFDAPYRAVFDEHGVHRHCGLRVHSLDWDSVTSFERPPRAPSPVARIKGTERKASGLVARVGPKRRYLLISAAERPDQWDQLSARLQVWAPAVSLPRRPVN